MRRVLVPGGKLFFSEHGLAPDQEVRVWQRRPQSWLGRVSGGCRLDRDIPTLLAEAGTEAHRSLARANNERQVPAAAFDRGSSPTATSLERALLAAFACRQP